MIFKYINNTNRTSDITRDKIMFTNSLKRRSDSCIFEVFQGTKPTENQDVKIYDGGFVESATNQSLVAYWKFDEVTGTTAADYSGNRNNVAFTGAPNWVDGQSGKAVELDGSTDFGTILDAPELSFGSNTMSFSLWFKCDPQTLTADDRHYLFVKGGDSGAYEYSAFIRSTGVIEFVLWQSGGSNVASIGYTPGTRYDDGEWHHLVGTSNGTTIALYVDGTFLDSNTSFTSSMSDTATNLYIGKRSDSAQFYDGAIDDLKLFDTALTQTEITELFNNPGKTRFIQLKDSYQLNVQTFRVGQELHIGIGENDEERIIVESYDESTKLLSTQTQHGTVLAEDERVGELIFGGIIARVKDQNLTTLDNIIYNVTCVGYEKIFDKKIVNDSWEDEDARYIINSFVNSTVNYNTTIDDLDYDNDTALQAEWIESGDGDNPTVDSVTYIEGDASAVFPWTNSSGTANWAATPTSKDISHLTGVSSGTPTGGALMVWAKTADQDLIDSFVIRVGSDSSNYAAVTFTLVDTTDLQYIAENLKDSAITGTPDWTATDYLEIVVDQTGDGQIQLNGIRVNADDSFTLYNVESSPLLDDVRAPKIKPVRFISQLAATFERVFYIDDERDIHYTDQENDPAPFEITDDTNNFTDLKIECDVSNIGNRIIVEGGEKTSESTYAQVVEGNDTVREWILKAKFNNLVVSVDNNTSTDTMEAGTTTTTVNATGHGLSVGDHIVNRTRSNAVREVLTVPDPNSFTVEAVPSQTTGDTFSLFSVSKTIGIEGLDDETTLDYVYNSNEKSVRAAINEATLVAGEFIRFEYNERIQISIQIPNSASITALRNLGIGDGIFDLDPIIDRNIEDSATALAAANARLNEFSNALVTGSFKTDQKGLKPGQLLHVVSSTGRMIDEYYVIQKVVREQKAGKYGSYMVHDVVFGTTLFGWEEFMQKLSETKDKIELNVDAVIEEYAFSDEIIETPDTNQVATGGGFLTAQEPETIETPDSNTVTDFTPPWKWEPNGAGQPLNTRWGLFEWT